MSVSLCDAAMAGNTEEVFRNEHNLLFFTRLVLSLSPFTVIIIFFTRFMLLIHSEQMTPLTLQLQVLIRLNMGEDVNQKHYPRSERLPGIHYYDITYMHIIHTYIYNYIFISHYHIVIVAQRSFQSFFAIFNFSVALSVLQICQIWH